MPSTREREEFVAIITAELANKAGPEETLEFARFLLRSEFTLHRLAEEACNRELTADEIEKQERVAAKVRGVCAERGIEVTFNSDPRGAAIYLRLPSGRSNDMGDRGYAVP